MKSFNIKKKEMKTEAVASYMGTAARKGNIAFNKYMVQACMVLVTALMIIGFGVTGDAEAVLSVKQGTIVKNTAAGAQAITGVGFQPKAIIFYWTKQTTTGYLASQSSGYGFAAAGTPITMAAVSIQALDNQTTTDANNYHSNAAAIAIQNTASGGALNNLGTITAFGADGFTLNWSAAGQADRISYIALGGSDITNAKVGTTSMFALTGNSSVTGVGFQPDTAFLISSINGNTLNTVTASLRTGLTFGFMSTTSGTTQGSLSVGNRDARTATGYIGGVWRNNGYTNLRATAADVQAAFSTWDADGFTMNATAAPNGAHNVSWLALQGGLFKLGSLAQPTATGTQAITGLGFQPSAVIFASANLNSASGTVSTTVAKQSFGAAAATQTGQWIGSAGTINSDENMNSSSTAAITLATGPTTTNAAASLSTFDADGFTLNWTTADATARNVLYVAMGTACTDADLATLTTTNPISSSTVGGTVTIQTQVGTEATPSGMTGMVVNIAGSTGCNVTNGVMSWNAGTSRWEYTWNTSACGTGTPDAGVTIDVSGTDPDCTTTVNAVQITNVTIDNTCTDSDPATAVTITPASSSTVGATVTVQGAITGEGAPGTGSAVVTITGSDACNATAQAMTWNSGASVWEYSWDTSACGTAAPDTGVSVSITYTDPDCSGAVVVNNTSTNITIDNVDPSAMPSCAGCHGYGATFTDGTARNNPAGTFPGSHNTHVATYSKVCSVCHTAPATETNADFKHRNETVQIASPINGLAGSTYSKTSFTQSNTFTPGFCSNTYCHSNGTSVISGSIPANSSATWGGTTTCLSCHGVGGGDDGRPNYANNTPKRNTHGDGASYGVTHKATECDICHTGVTGTTGAYTISDTTTHNNGAYNIQASLGYTQATGVCATPGCHGSATWGGPAMTCVECHAAIVTAPNANTASGGTVTQRQAVVGEFGLAWGHKKTGRGAVTVSDCIVCHLEGVFATQAKSATYHGDGYIDLRDPDVAGETRITNIAGTSYRFVQFATSYVAGSRTSTGHLAENVDNILTQKFCLKCHDAGGAANTTARTTYGTPTNAMPFGGVALGANYTAANGAIGTQGLINVAAQLATANSSYHPVLGPKNRDFPTAVRMNDPYKPLGTRGTSGTLSQGVVINCFDCHNTPTTPLTTRTVSAHGNANTIRGVATVTGTPAVTTNQVTFCIVCHAGYDTNTTSTHAAGSALSGTTNNTMTAYLRYGCNICHGSSYTTAVVRPVRAMDVHGSNVVPTGTITKSGRWAGGGGPIAFIRNSNVFDDHAPLKVGVTNYTPVCMGGEDGVNGTQNTPACDRGFENYTVGGTY